MISEESCDTEDWSNDAENSALIIGINYSLLYIHKENSYFKCIHISQFSVYFGQTNAASVSRTDQKNPKKNFLTPNFWMIVNI